MMLQTKARRPGESQGGPDVEFLFIIGDAVVGRITADCCNCAWNQGHPRWPTAVMAFCHDAPSGSLPLGCIKVLNRRLREERESRLERDGSS